MHNDSVVASDNSGLVKQFSEKFADLIDGGNSIVWSLFEIEHEEDDPSMKRVVRNVRTDVELGARLADAMAKHQQFFNDTYVNEVRQGEKTDLRVTFRKLASH